MLISKNNVISIISLKKHESVPFYSGSGSTIPGSGSPDPDPYQNEANPKHWFLSPV